MAVVTKIVKGTVGDGFSGSGTDTQTLAYKIKQVTDTASVVHAVAQAKSGRIGTAVIVYEA